MPGDTKAAAKIMNDAMADVKSWRGAGVKNICTRRAKTSEVSANKREKVAGTTGLEPATSDVTGRRSNQLNYVPAMT